MGTVITCWSGVDGRSFEEIESDLAGAGEVLDRERGILPGHLGGGDMLARADARSESLLGLGV